MLFWRGAVGLAVVAAVLAVPGLVYRRATVLPSPLAGVVVQVALLAYESVFVRAGQDVPLS